MTPHDNSVIDRTDSVIEPVEHHSTTKPHVEPDDADLSPLDLHMAPHIDDDLPDICSVCARPTKKHTATQAFKCMRMREERLAARDEEEEVVEQDPFDRPGDWYIVHTVIAREEKAKRAIEARFSSMGRAGEVVYKSAFPGYVLVRCELDDSLLRLIRQVPDVSGFLGSNGSRPTPLSRSDVEAMLVDEQVAAPIIQAEAEVITPTEVISGPTPLLEPFTAPAPAAVPLNDKGEVDYLELARAMRTVIEQERDEVVRRGGPLEKQNFELKERLHKALEDANMWRTRHHAAVQERNSYKEQLDAQIKINRKLRNDQSEKKTKDHVRLVELEDILRVVDKTPGWTREMGGTGHWQIYKAGVWVSDAAGSGGSTRVNMATRTKLRAKGLKV